MAVVTKILEQTLAAGDTSVVFTDTDIPNSLIRVFSSNPDIIPVSRILSGNSLTVSYEAQSNAMDVAVEIAKQGLEIVDNVTSTNTDKALSANQGKVLKDAIDGIVVPTSFPASAITYDNTVSGMTADDVQDAIDEVFTSVSDGKEQIADAITDKGVPTSATDSFSTMATNISNISGGGGGSNTFYYIRTVSTGGSNAAVSVMACTGPSRLYYNTWVQYNTVTSGLTIGDIILKYGSGYWTITSGKQIFSLRNNQYVNPQPRWSYSATYEDMIVT